ncbi:MAG: sulfite reductase subunit C [Cellulosilyticaceae bacterium]
MDIDTKRIKKNAFRVTKVRQSTAARIRVPGGKIDADTLMRIAELAKKRGNGRIHITIRQGFEILGIPYEAMYDVNEDLKPIIQTLEMERGVDVVEEGRGYHSSGTRNISACIGNEVCPFANYDTTDLAIKIEKTVFPNDHHVKIACTGCPNDCVKAHMQDFGIIGQTKVQYNQSLCVACNACVRMCQKKVTGALSMKNGRIEQDKNICIGCGECVLVCPTHAWTRSDTKYYKIVIMGRTGKKNPRIALPFLEFVTEDVVLQVVKNVYAYIDEYIDKALPKEHVGYIVDRTGYKEFKDWVLKDVKLTPGAKVAEYIYWEGYKYIRNVNMEVVE